LAEEGEMSESENAGGGLQITVFQSELEKQAAQVAGKALGRVADGTLDIGGNIVGGLFGDRIREWRTRNLVSALSKTADFLKAKGIPLDKAKALPMGEAYAMFEESSKQDDPALQEMWSALLANAMDATSGVAIDPAFVSTLKIMGGAEAHVLRFVRDFARGRSEASKLLPTSNMFLSLGDSDEQREREEKQRAVCDKFAALVSQSFVDRIGKRFTDTSIENAIGLLLKEGCLSIPTPTFSNRKFTRRGEGGYVGSSEEVDEARLIDALDEIAWSVEIQRGVAGEMPALLPKSRQSGELLQPSYSLTAYGERLLSACEPPAKA
jgi:hypothetical protein